MVKENLYTKDCIRTYTGKYVNVFEPTPDMFCIEDIAHALSFQCRFGAHLPRFYSVAQHSLMVSVKSNNRLAGLMHDASEAYLMDIPRPIKNRLAGYKEIEHNLMITLSNVFGFIYPLPDDVKQADEWCLEKEWDEVFINNRYLPVWSPAVAEWNFLERFKQLK